MLDPITGPLALEDIETTDTTELVKWAVLLQNAITARMLISMTPRSINHIADRCAEGWRMGTAVVTDSEGRAFVDLIGTTPGNTHIQGFADLVEQEPMSSAH